MEISVFSVLMTILWSSVLIALLCFLRTKTELLHICSISTIILLYLFCVVRLVLPIELPWTCVMSGGAVYRKIHSVFFSCKISSVRLYEMLFAIWIVGMLYNLSKYLFKYYRAMCGIRSIPKSESGESRRILDRLNKGKYIELIKTSAVKSPCCIGILKKRILLPDKEYGTEALNYILLHEYTHLCSNDIVLKTLVMLLCGIYWWNPVVYLLQKELSQSIEIRCDLRVTGYLDENERADYLAVILDVFRERSQSEAYFGAVGLVEEYSESLIERFRIVADRKVVKKKHASAAAAFMMLLVLMISYSFILQSSYEAPISEIETDERIYHADPENAYIIRRGSTYILYTSDTESTISEETAKMLLEDGFVEKGGD